MELNKVVCQYLMSSYLYYELGLQVISDDEYDNLCKTLLEKFDDVEYIHKHLLDKDSLRAGTGFGIQYTNMIKQSALDWHRSYNGKK